MRVGSTVRLRWMIGIAMLAGATTALGQSYPTRPIKVIVGFGPGGVADVIARVVGRKLGAILGQTIIVENKPTAGGIVAADTVAKAEPDGYTLLLMTNGNAVSASLFRSLPYDIRKDLAPVSTLGFFDVAIVAGRDSHIDSLSDMIAYAKANPGKLDIGTINIGSTQNLAAELFKSMTGMVATIVPFKGSPAVIEALRSNEVQIGFEMLAPIVQQARSGAVKILAVASDRRYPGLPDVPTAGEAGVPGYTASSWNAIAAPTKTPREVIERLNQAVNQALVAPEVQQKLALQGVVARGSTPAQMGILVGDDIEKWRKVIERAHIERQ